MADHRCNYCGIKVDLMSDHSCPGFNGPGGGALYTNEIDRVRMELALLQNQYEVKTEALNAKLSHVITTLRTLDGNYIYPGDRRQCSGCPYDGYFQDAHFESCVYRTVHDLLEDITRA